MTSNGIKTVLPPENVKRYTISSPFLALNTLLGEGPFHDRRTDTLRFVDIERNALYLVDPSDARSVRSFSLPMCVTATAELVSGSGSQEGEFLFAGKQGVGVMRAGGAWRWIARFWAGDDDGVTGEKERRFRSNDAAVDARGRYFVGTMNDPLEDEIRSEGTLFRLDPDLRLHVVKYPVTIPNGMSWSADNKYIYITESSENAITKYPYDIESGAIDFDGGTPFFQCPYEGGQPDGHARDEDGCFWIALYGVGKVVRVDIDGHIIAEVELPTRCVTCPAFCGQSLYITVAMESDPDQYPDSARWQGNVFAVDVGIRGAALNTFVLKD